MTGRIPPAVNCSYPVRDGNTVTPLVGGPIAFSRIRASALAATCSVWVTVAFLHDTFRFPGTDETFVDLMDTLAARGLDVRVLFWRHDPETAQFADDTFAGTALQRLMLEARQTRWSARWDRASAGNCQHQKSWVIDAETSAPTAYVGGMNLNPTTLLPPTADDSTHDVYAEIRGPVCADVAHNFIQRWNEASERDRADGTFGPSGAADLPFPTSVPDPTGDTVGQVQRSIGPGRYRTTIPALGAEPFPIDSGERSIGEQYRAAIGAASSSILVENQSFLDPDILRALEDAADRGVHITAILPYVAERHVQRARHDPTFDNVFAAIENLARHPHTTIAGLIPSSGLGRIHVHSKVMVVDEQWSTIGSCNLRHRNLTLNTELNISTWSGDVARALRTQLFDQHLGEATADLSADAAHDRFSEVARTNRSAHEAGLPHPGLAVEIDAESYGFTT